MHALDGSAADSQERQEAHDLNQVHHNERTDPNRAGS